MIKVTLEFPSIEAAIATLGKIMVAAPKAGVVKDKVVAPAPAPVEGDKPQPPGVVPAQAAATTRKPRADAGKKRGSYKNAEASATPVSPGENTGDGQTQVTDASKAADQAANSTSTPSDAPKGATPPAKTASVPPSEADAQAALEKVFTNKSLAAAQDVLARFGVKRLRDLLPEQRADFIQLAEESAK